ncbi:MAG: hypothetical protein WCQ71_03825 [Bacilli bacterium]
MSIIKKNLVVTIAATLLLVLGSCVSQSSSEVLSTSSNSQSCSDSPSSEINDSYLNIYNGTGDFHIAKWQAESSSVYTEVTESKNDNSTFVRYNKTGSLNPNSPLIANISSLTTDFRYINITILGVEGRTGMLHIGNSTLSSLVLGIDRTIVFENGATTFSYDIAPLNAWMLDNANTVSFIVEPGLRGLNNNGTFTIMDTWFSETMPLDSTLAKSSPWSGSGTLLVSQLDDITEISYKGIAQGSWQYVATDVNPLDVNEYNTLNLTFENLDDSVVYLSIKTVAADNPSNTSQLTWDNAEFGPNNTAELHISLSKPIRKIIIFVCSSGIVPSGEHSGKFAITNYNFSYVDPSLQSLWNSTGLFLNNRGEGESTFTYTNLPNGEWNQNITASVEHSYPDNNAVSLTAENLGEERIYLFIKAQDFSVNNSAEISSGSYSLAAGEEKTVTLFLDRQVDKIVVWVNASKYDGIAGATTDGIIRLTNPVFSFETAPEVAPAWSGNSFYQITDNQNGTVSVSYENLIHDSNHAWYNIQASVLHVLEDANGVVIDFNNTGLEAVHIQVVLRDASGEFSWTPFWLDVDGTYHYSKIVTRQISKIVLFITSINTVPDGTYSGSFVMTNPVFTNLD